MQCHVYVLFIVQKHDRICYYLEIHRQIFTRLLRQEADFRYLEPSMRKTHKKAGQDSATRISRVHLFLWYTMESNSRYSVYTKIEQ